MNAENPRESERFADLVERTVVTLKENKDTSDLEGGSSVCYCVGKNFPIFA